MLRNQNRSKFNLFCLVLIICLASFMVLSVSFQTAYALDDVDDIEWNLDAPDIKTGSEEESRDGDSNLPNITNENAADSQPSLRASSNTQNSSGSQSSRSDENTNIPENNGEVQNNAESEQNPEADQAVGITAVQPRDDVEYVIILARENANETLMNSIDKALDAGLHVRNAEAQEQEEEIAADQEAAEIERMVNARAQELADQNYRWYHNPWAIVALVLAGVLVGMGLGYVIAKKVAVEQLDEAYDDINLYPQNPSTPDKYDEINKSPVASVPISSIQSTHDEKQDTQTLSASSDTAEFLKILQDEEKQIKKKPISSQKDESSLQDTDTFLSLYFEEEQNKKYDAPKNRFKDSSNKSSKKGKRFL